MAGASLCLAPAEADVQPGTRCPAGEPCVIVHLEGDRTGTFIVDADTIEDEADQIGKSYLIRGPDGSTDTEAGSGLSINKIIGLIGIDPDSVTFSQAVRRDGQRSDLVEGDFGPSGEAPFQDGLVPIVKVEGTKDGILYVRPLRDDNDVNQGDYFQTESRSALDLYVHTEGRPLRPQLTATPQDQPQANAPVQFEAAGATGPDLTYAWTFGDGQTSRTTSPTTQHQYARTSTSGQDSFEAFVEVNGSDSSSGRSNQVRVSIGTAPPSSTPAPGTGSTTSPDAPATGPDRSKGDTSGAAPSTTPGGSGSGAGGTTDAPSAPSTSDVPTGNPEVTPGDGLVDVSGILLGQVDASGQIQPASPSERQLAAAAARAGSSSGPTPYGAIGGGLGVALLLGVGAASESGWVRRRLTRLGAELSVRR